MAWLLKMRVITIYDDEREVIVTSVSTYVVYKGNQMKAKLGQKMKWSARPDFI